MVKHWINNLTLDYTTFLFAFSVGRVRQIFFVTSVASDGPGVRADGRGHRAGEGPHGGDHRARVRNFDPKG